MLPSSGGSSGTKRSGSNLRRYGPIAAIVAAVAVVGGALALTGGDDDDDEQVSVEEAGTTPSADEADGSRTEAISFDQAQEQGLELDFGETCDPELGRAAIPYHFAQACYASVEDNGGATARGVTGDAIKVVVYLPPETDPIIDFITAAIANDDTNAQIEATYRSFAEIFERTYQTYGRRVDFTFLEGSGIATDPVAARADAVRAAEDLGAFAAWGGPALTDAWRQELAARGVVVLGYGGPPTLEGFAETDPYVQSISAIGSQQRAHLVEWMQKSIAGRPAENAGQPELQSRERTFGLLYISTGAETEAGADDLEAQMAEAGMDLTERVPYELDPARLQEQAASAIARLESAGVTSVIFNGDPVAPAAFTQEATRQEYFPEWIHSPSSAFVDTTAYGRTYDQQQWAHFFGVTMGSVRVEADVAAFWTLHEWFHGAPPAADDSYAVFAPIPASFYAAIAAAGPELTPESFAEGLRARAPRPAVTLPTLSWGDHGIWPDGEDPTGLDDAIEIWWDAGATGPDELRREGRGMMRYVAGGERHLPGEWPEGESRVFEEAGSVTILDEIPPEERVPDYPSPAGTG